MQDLLAIVVAYQPLMRLALRQFLMEHARISRCLEVAEPADVLRLLESHRPNLVVMTACSVSKDTPRVVRDVRRMVRDQRVLVVGPASDEDLVQRVIRAGALGFVTVLDDLDEVALGVASVMAHSLHVSRLATSGLLRGLVPEVSRTGAAGSENLTALSDRELEVFQRIGDGLSGKEIARILCISIKTVDTHKKRIREKLNLRGGAQLVRMAVNQVK